MSHAQLTRANPNCTPCSGTGPACVTVKTTFFVLGWNGTGTSDKLCKCSKTKAPHYRLQLKMSLDFQSNPIGRGLQISMFTHCFVLHLFKITECARKAGVELADPPASLCLGSARTEGVNHHTWLQMVSKEMKKQMWARERERQMDLPDICAVRREGQGTAPSTCEDQTQRGAWIKPILLTS